MSIQDAIASVTTDPDDRTAILDAQTWLLDIMGEEGVVAVAEAMASAKKVGISESTIKRARKKAKIRSVSTHTFPRAAYWFARTWDPEDAAKWVEDRTEVADSRVSPWGSGPTELTGLTEPTADHLQSVQSVQLVQSDQAPREVDQLADTPDGP